MKPAIFHPEALVTIRGFPDDVRRELGKVIYDLQRGERLGMPLSRPMPVVGAGVGELRIRDKSGNYRLFYLAKLARGVFVFHAFVKKTQQTPKREISLAKSRLKELLDE